MSSPAASVGIGRLDEVDHHRRSSRRRAFEEVALIHLDRVYRMACRLCHGRALAEDLAQETYLRAFMYFHQFKLGTNCRAWLFAILHNVFVRQMEREARQVLALDEDLFEQGADDSWGLTVTIPGPEEELFRHVVDKDLVEALGRLPVQFRAAVLLVDVEGRSYRETAQICRVPVGTVMSRLFRARRRIRTALMAARVPGCGANGDAAPASRSMRAASRAGSFQVRGRPSMVVAGSGGLF